jgi:hypothetical protein
LFIFWDEKILALATLAGSGFGPGFDGLPRATGASIERIAGATPGCGANWP